VPAVLLRVRAAFRRDVEVVVGAQAGRGGLRDEAA